jgi:hypothetical protein
VLEKENSFLISARLKRFDDRVYQCMPKREEFYSLTEKNLELTSEKSATLGVCKTCEICSS